MSALTDRIRRIIASGNDMTIATVRPDGWPQAVTVSYAGDGLAIYFGTGAASQKARNLAKNNKVSLTINLPYADWNHIEGISAAGLATRITDPAELARFGQVMLAKFPQVMSAVPPEGAGEMAMFRVTLTVVSVLDYTKGFGHTELVELGAAATA
ncbi:MAG: pyridoxamine 5'-phosphate oxidase family protein [Rhizomicrobium sp.]